MRVVYIRATYSYNLLYILDKTGTRLQDVNKQNDLIELIDELFRLKQQIKFI